MGYTPKKKSIIGINFQREDDWSLLGLLLLYINSHVFYLVPKVRRNIICSELCAGLMLPESVTATKSRYCQMLRITAVGEMPQCT